MKILLSKTFMMVILIILAVGNLWAVGNSARGEELNVQTLNQIIRRKKKDWVAAENSKSRLSLAEKRNLCGLLRKRRPAWDKQNGGQGKPAIPGTGYSKARGFTQDGSYLVVEDKSSHEERFSAAVEPVVNLPSRFDWRAKDNRNWTTPIRNQGSCGSCWAHASIAVMETMMKIGLDESDLNPDYSEQFMLSCTEGGCSGWFMDSSAAFLRTTGVPSEACFPYRAQDVPCEGRCPDWEKQIEKIPDWNWVSGYPQTVNPTLIKQKLMKGPLLVAMTVYNDFMYYSHGAYEHVDGSVIGDHAVTIVGWDDSDHSWICKNSWGPNWGDSGWFKIKMGKNECGIEDSVIFYSTPIDWNCDLEEGFENGGGIPPEWDRKVGDVNYSWKTTNALSYEGLQAATVEYDPDLHPQDEVLLSWQIKGSDVSVAFAFMGSYYWGVSQGHYQVSLWAVRGEWDSGTGDDILITENIMEDHLQYDDESWTWVPVRYNLPPELNNTTFRLAFHYQGIDGAQFCLDKVCIEGMQQTGCACTMDDSGALDISQGTDSIPIRIQNAPREVGTFGCDIIYDSSLTSYLGFEPGKFFKDLSFFDCQEVKAGQIRCVGSNNGSDRSEKVAPSNYTGTLVTLRFSPITSKTGKCSLCLENLADDMEGWQTTNGCLLAPAPCTADVNGDGQITPKDALCIYEKSLNICPTTFGGSCSEICCDMDMDKECTDSDAAILFRKYMTGDKANP